MGDSPGIGAEGVHGSERRLIDHIEISSGAKNFVLCPGKAYDRSPCGTGTSAKLACFSADGKLKQGEVWRQESIVGSVFEGTIGLGEDGCVHPRIQGSAFMNAEAVLILDPKDPFVMGFGVERVAQFACRFETLLDASSLPRDWCPLRIQPVADTTLGHCNRSAQPRWKKSYFDTLTSR